MWKKSFKSNCVLLSSENTGHRQPVRSSFSVTDCEPTAMSDPVVIETSRADGLLRSTCKGHSTASLDDGIVDTAKWVRSTCCFDSARHLLACWQIPSSGWSEVTEIQFPSVPLCLDYSESSEEESAGEREEEIHAHNEATCFSETPGVPAEHSSTPLTGESCETATSSCEFTCSSALLRPMQHHNELNGWSVPWPGSVI